MKGFNQKDELMQQLVKDVASISHINHDINNHLTVISLSIRRIRKAGERFQDDKLIKTSQQLQAAICEIEKILTKLKPIKNNDIIKDFKKEKSE